MNRRLVVAALACSLVLAGCLGGAGGAPESTTTETTATETPATATETTAERQTTEGTQTTTEARTTEMTTTTTAEPPRHRTYYTHEALAANTSFSVPKPNVSAPFAFESGIVMELAGSEYVAMAYHDAENGSLENVLSIRKAENESQYDLTAGNATTVGDRDARYVAEESGGKLVWECDGYVYRVSVQQFTDEFGEAELRAVAESVGCE
ncbi:hypothetical protein M0R88_02125 [Halorussus gelatinilyticus]|uniref:DUF4367 domain-containing protein n=1 Tax=Halorussus gelatinilyticus TaxID=2937524 RepID=A0A8U0IKR4_9EURY|nr:hypothetical protein [Halorussus gelatinilyticus]UPW00912.1 hypothetical protein M0R88_02125 [Halorussus gelatinilyticus]